MALIQGFLGAQLGPEDPGYDEACRHRPAPGLIARCADPDDVALAIERAARCSRRGRPAASTSTSSALEGEDRVRAAFGDAYDRFVEVKTAWDPHNVFSGNQNIRPARLVG